MIRKNTISAMIAVACLANLVGNVRGEEPTKKAPAKLTSANVAQSETGEYCPPSYANAAPGAAGYGGYGGYGGYQSNGPKAFGYSWGTAGNSRDCNRFYHYPYVFYPQNFRSAEAYQSSDSMYYRYAPEMQIPVYNRNWHNEYPSARRYHWGHHFLTDVF
jgi:hypothetical protein